MQWCQRLDADYGVDPWIWKSLHGPSFHLSSKLCLDTFLFIFFINISNVIPFPGFPSRKPLSHPPSPCFYEGAPPPIHSSPPTPAFPYTGESSLHRIMGISFFRLGKFSFIILLKIFTGPLNWVTWFILPHFCIDLVFLFFHRKTQNAHDFNVLKH